MSARPMWRDRHAFAAELRRLNRILIPKTREERERWHTSRAARIARRLSRAAGRLTADGQLLVALVFVTGLFALDVRRSDLYVAWAIAGGLILASVAHALFLRPTGLVVEVVLPRNITVGERTTFVITTRNDGPRAHDALVVSGSMFGWDGAWQVRKAGIARLCPGASEKVLLSARFRSRGEHRLEAVRVQAKVPFGLALGAAASSDAATFLVVPRVARVSSIALPQGNGYEPQRHARASTEGGELVGVRPYRFGDPVRDLHARTWARVGAPVVREYRSASSPRVGIVLDTSVGTGREAAFEAALSLVAGLIARIERTEATVEVVALGAEVVDRNAERGADLLRRVLALLACVEPGPTFDPQALALRLEARRRHLSCVVFVSVSWDDERRAFVERLGASGASVTSIVVDEGTLPGVRTVSPLAIANGEAISL